MKDKMMHNLVSSRKFSAGKCGLSTVVVFLVLFQPASAARHEPSSSCEFQIERALDALINPKTTVVADKIPTVAYEDLIKGRVPRLRNTPVYEFRTHDRGYVTVLDLSSSKVRGNPNVMRALELWNERVKLDYQSRLKKFMSNDHEERNSAIESLEYYDRSVIVLNTVKSINDGAPELRGGIRMVYARRPEEKLPFQHEFPDYVRSGAAAEVGRLVGPGSSPLLLNSVMRVVERDAEVKEIYVHTSAAHVRLYSRLGATPDRVDKRDDLNVILRFERDRIHGVIENTERKLGSSASYPNS